MLETIRHETTLGGEPVTLEVTQLPAVQALRLLNRLTAVVAGGLAGLTKGRLDWLTDADFEHAQRTLLHHVGVRTADGVLVTLDFDGFMARIGGDAEAVLELLWTVLAGTYPRSFSKARAMLSNPASLTRLLEVLAPKRPAVAAAAVARTAPAKSAPPPGVVPPTSKASAY